MILYLKFTSYLFPLLIWRSLSGELIEALYVDNQFLISDYLSPIKYIR